MLNCHTTSYHEVHDRKQYVSRVINGSERLFWTVCTSVYVFVVDRKGWVEMDIRAIIAPFSSL